MPLYKCEIWRLTSLKIAIVDASWYIWTNTISLTATKRTKWKYRCDDICHQQITVYVSSFDQLECNFTPFFESDQWELFWSSLICTVAGRSECCIVFLYHRIKGRIGLRVVIEYWSFDNDGYIWFCMYSSLFELIKCCVLYSNGVFYSAKKLLWKRLSYLNYYKFCNFSFRRICVILPNKKPCSEGCSSLIGQYTIIAIRSIIVFE